MKQRFVEESYLWYMKEKAVNIRIFEKRDTEKLIMLLSQLSTSFAEHNLPSLIGDPSCCTFVIEYDNTVVGTGSLISYATPSKGLVGRIEDVVIDETMRGKGLGKIVVKTLIETAQKKGVTTLDLTSKRTRRAARDLYTSLGFHQRTDSDLFRLKL